jgi:hypothetical protein
MDDFTLPTRIDLPSGNGAYVEFVDLDDVTGADVQAMRRHIRRESSEGEISNLMMAEAVRIAVKTWNVPYLADPRTPEANPAGIRRLKAVDFNALEAAVLPLIQLVHGETAPGTGAGTPTQPDSD